ncbi:hypothetical protein CRE_12198 [Caenorhabditis remanei]|uniref:Uncharacterized protein n=1 Tax=Caenorhabditis remanei TaxID=31234 RepID=E3N079_CAERE|nr:hypothetical protein CRE_12198 [Caenorhabditis remanei]
MPIDKLFDGDVSGIPLLAVPNDDNTRYVILEGHQRVPTALGDICSMDYRGCVYRNISKEKINFLNNMPLDKMFDEDVSGTPVLAVPGGDDDTRCVVMQGCIDSLRSCRDRSLKKRSKSNRFDSFDSLSRLFY